MSPNRARVWHALLSAAALALLVWYARSVDWRTAWDAVRAASIWLLVVATVANLLTLLAKALTWWIFLRPIGAPSFSLALRATVAGAGLNNLLVANSGEAARAVFVSRAAGVSMSQVVASLALERLFDFLGYIILLIATTFLLPLPAEVARWRVAAVVVLVVIGAGLAVLLWRGPQEPPPEVVAAPANWRARVAASVMRFNHALHAIASGPRMAAAFVLAGANWVGQIACYHLTARAAHFPITLAGSIAALLAANVGFAVRATPGNVGLFQVIYAVTAEALGLSRSAAVGVAVLLQALQNIPVTLLGAAVAPDLVLSRRRATPAPPDASA